MISVQYKPNSGICSRQRAGKHALEGGGDFRNQRAHDLDHGDAHQLALHPATFAEHDPDIWADDIHAHNLIHEIHGHGTDIEQTRDGFHDSPQLGTAVCRWGSLCRESCNWSRCYYYSCNVTVDSGDNAPGCGTLFYARRLCRPHHHPAQRPSPYPTISTIAAANCSATRRLFCSRFMLCIRRVRVSKCTEHCRAVCGCQKRPVRKIGPRKFKHNPLCFGTWRGWPFPSARLPLSARLLSEPGCLDRAALSQHGFRANTKRRPMSLGWCSAS